MKRKQFVSQLVRDGCKLLRPGAKHDIYVNSHAGQKQPMPRHTEIDNALAKHVRKYLGLHKECG